MYPDVSKVFYFEGVTHLTLGKRGELDVFSHMRSHGFITMGVGKLWHWEPIGEPFTRGTGAHFPRWGTYSQEWGCEDKDAGGRCSPRKEEVPDGDVVMGRVYPTSDPAESLFDYRVASDANKKLALGARSSGRCGDGPSSSAWASITRTRSGAFRRKLGVITRVGE